MTIIVYHRLVWVFLGPPFTTQAPVDPMLVTNLVDALAHAVHHTRGHKPVNFLAPLWPIMHQQCLDKLDAMQATPTPQQLAQLASATRTLLALHPINDDGSCRICTPWWRSPRRICAIYAAFAHLSPANQHDPQPDAISHEARPPKTQAGAPVP